MTLSQSCSTKPIYCVQPYFKVWGIVFLENLNLIEQAQENVKRLGQVRWTDMMWYMHVRAHP